MLAFVIGTGRCGSTMLTELIARHPEVGFVSNMDDKLARLNLKGRWNNTLFSRAAERDPSLVAFEHRRRLVERGRVRVAPSEGWSLLERQVSGALVRPCRDLTAADASPWLVNRIQEFFDTRIAAQHTPAFVHHVTGWPRAGLLSAAYPDARFIHVVRDGRAVANSWLQMGWWDGYRGPDRWFLGPLPPAYRDLWEESGRSFVSLAGLGWRMLIEAALEAEQRAPEGQWLTVRHEDVLEDPRGQMKSVLEFLGLDWTPAFEAGFTRHHISSTRGRSWLRDLTAAQAEQLEDVIAEPLVRLGYPRR
ncbi:sulfotransferase family protein [Oryzihumus leptocrescens]|uniref:Sulfotransferase family protein n=1 Tax=Oryzihumus leptocrescens TaxID=297536 RepID=A0A542ZF48_9MICO|nr:sulfotransferase [Oryzihumus leptocrescens]TQL58954.1 sulfotransferase family protein [Oryzihumus leptocrescens]